MLLGSTLGRYFSLLYLRTMAVVFATVFGLVYVVDFLQIAHDSSESKDSLAVLAGLALLRTPALTEQALPFAVLLGAMGALLVLNRRLELVVARAAGVSAWQFLQPGILVAGLIGLATVTLYNPLGSALSRKAAALETRLLDDSHRKQLVQIFLRQTGHDGQAIIQAGSSVANTTRLMRVTIFTFDKAGAFEDRIEAREAVFRDGYWELRDARVLNERDEPQDFSRYLLASHLEPAHVRQTLTEAEAVGFWDLPDAIAQAERAGLDPTRYRLQFDVLLARPFLFVVMILVAASVCLKLFRLGGVRRLAAGGISAGFGLYVVTRLTEKLGISGLLGPAAAAWFPVLLGSLLGSLALLYQEDG